MIELEHPKLPGRVIRVHEAGVRQREKSGWRRVDRAAPAPDTPEDHSLPATPEPAAPVEVPEQDSIETA